VVLGHLLRFDFLVGLNANEEDQGTNKRHGPSANGVAPEGETEVFGRILNRVGLRQGNVCINGHGDHATGRCKEREEGGARGFAGMRALLGGNDGLQNNGQERREHCKEHHGADSVELVTIGTVAREVDISDVHIDTTIAEDGQASGAVLINGGSRVVVGRGIAEFRLPQTVFISTPVGK